MECLLGDNEKTLQQPFVTGAPGGWDSFNEKMNGKLSKNVWQFTQHNCENGSKTTQKKVLKWRVHLKAMEKRYRNYV